MPRFNRHKNPAYVQHGRVKRYFTEEEDQLIVRLRKAGWSLGEIGKHVNRPKGSIDNALRRIAVWEEHHEARG